MFMYSANVRARLPLLIGRFATLVVGQSLTEAETWALVASALIAAGVMSGVPTMYWSFRLEATVLRPLKPMTIAVTPKMMRIAAAKKPPISSALRISYLL